MILKTATGKELEVDLCVESGSTQRLYVHFPGKTLLEMMVLFGNGDELPFAEYQEYTVIEKISTSTTGVNVDLKKQES